MLAQSYVSPGPTPPRDIQRDMYIYTYIFVKGKADLFY